jgi:hypothetical protein
MASKPLPSQEVLRQLLRYEPETGRLFWRERSAEQMNCSDPRGKEWAANQWNSRNAGKEAFTASDHGGYRKGKINGAKYLAHRVIWKLVYGVDPDVIDHVNRVTNDNRVHNLRSCTVADNSRNYRKTNNSSRYRGVSWVKRDQVWAARISNGKGSKISLGNHHDEDEAARAYDRAARVRHGSFAILNFPDDIRSALVPPESRS